jgi:hypothetical protein
MVEKTIDAHRIFPLPGLPGGPITSNTDDRGARWKKNWGWYVDLADIWSIFSVGKVIILVSPPPSSEWRGVSSS